MRMTDGLQHYGEITNPNDVNYYHGYGLGKRANRIGNGFYSREAVWRRSDNFAISTYTANLRGDRRAIGVSPFYGLFYTLFNGVISVIDRNLNVIATHSVPDVSTGVKAQGLVTIDGKGNGVVIASGIFYHINGDGTIKNQATHTVKPTAETHWRWACVNPKKDVFAFNVYGVTRLVKLSTLQIVNNDLIPSSTNITNAKFYFLKNNKMILCPEIGASSYRIIEINYDTNTLTKETTINLPTSNEGWYLMGVAKKGKVLFSSSSERKVVSVEPETGAYTTLVTWEQTKTTFVDFDEKYLYGYLNDSSSVSIANAVVHDIKTGLLVKNAGGSGVEPWQFKGKMPITEKFF